MLGHERGAWQACLPIDVRAAAHTGCLGAGDVSSSPVIGRMCSQTAPQASIASSVASAVAPVDVTISSEQRPAGQLKPRQRAVPVPRTTIRSLSALALMDSLAASPYSSWADSYRGNGHQYATPICAALRPVRCCELLHVHARVHTNEVVAPDSPRPPCICCAAVRTAPRLHAAHEAAHSLYSLLRVVATNSCVVHAHIICEAARREIESECILAHCYSRHTM